MAHKRPAIFSLRHGEFPIGRCITLAVISATRYYPCMIRSFVDRDTERLFARQPVRKLGSTVRRRALSRLLILDAAGRLDDLRVPPGNRLEKLRGDRVGQYSIRINNQWRICFRWHQGDAYDVEIVDYQR